MSTPPIGYESSILALGAPGLGKSTFAASVAEIVPPSEVLPLITKPGEERSYGYRQYGLADHVELFHDTRWRPGLGELKATDYKRLLERIYGLYDDEDYGAVIIDPLTDVFKMLKHKILAPSGVSTPAEFSDTFGFYRQLADEAEEFVGAASVLSTDLVARPKWVIMPLHTQPPKEAPPGKDESSDARSKGIEYEGRVLPMLDGSYRRKLAGDVSLVVYCDIHTRAGFSGGERTESTEYVIRVVPNNEKHAKVRLAPSLKESELPNSMKALLEAVEEANEAD